MKIYVSKFVVLQDGMALFAVGYGVYPSLEEAERSNYIQCQKRYPNTPIQYIDTFAIPDKYIDEAYLDRH